MPEKRIARGRSEAPGCNYLSRTLKGIQSGFLKSSITYTVTFIILAPFLSPGSYSHASSLLPYASVSKTAPPQVSSPHSNQSYPLKHRPIVRLPNSKLVNGLPLYLEQNPQVPHPGQQGLSGPYLLSEYHCPSSFWAPWAPATWPTVCSSHSLN